MPNHIGKGRLLTLNRRNLPPEILQLSPFRFGEAHYFEFFPTGFVCHVFEKMCHKDKGVCCNCNTLKHIFFSAHQNSSKKKRVLAAPKTSPAVRGRALPPATARRDFASGFVVVLLPPPDVLNRLVFAPSPTHPAKALLQGPRSAKAATRMPPPTAAASQPTVAPQWQPRPSANAQPAAAIGSAAYPCGRAHNPSAAWGPRPFGFPGVGLLLALPAAAHAPALRAAARTMALRLCCALPPAACASGFVSSALRVVRRGWCWGWCGFGAFGLGRLLAPAALVGAAVVRLVSAGAFSVFWGSFPHFWGCWRWFFFLFFRLFCWFSGC